MIVSQLVASSLVDTRNWFLSHLKKDEDFRLALVEQN